VQRNERTVSHVHVSSGISIIASTRQRRYAFDSVRNQCPAKMFVVNADLFDLSRKGIDAGIVCKEREEAFKVNAELLLRKYLLKSLIFVRHRCAKVVWILQ
jgi:hypothetical protein